jgi:signal transduction histidine kinase
VAQNSNNMAAVISWIAGAVALAVALILPVGYFVVSYQAIGAQLVTEAQFRSGMISQFVGTSPELWQFDRHHIEEMLSRDPPLPANQKNQLVTPDGKLIAAMGGDPAPPVTVRAAGVFDAGVPVGELRIVHSIRHLWLETAVAALIGILLGAAVFIALRVLPLRALQRATEALHEEVRQHDRARAAAETANRAKSQFLAAASHDLRQPLHALGLFAASLSEKARDPEVRAIVDNINASVEALEALFNELLDISKLDAGVIQPSLASFSVGPLFDRLRLDYEPEARERGLYLRIVPSTARVYSDPTLLERMLRNLIVNAIRYTDRGGVVVGCRPRGEGYSIEVWDSGVGIAADKLDKIFEEFYQVGNPERDRRKGLGLGLAIVKRIEQLLGYQMQVATRSGRGSVFRFSVPRGRTETLVRDGIARAGADAHGLQDKCVVVVDDELTVREGMKALLSGWGCDVIAADSLSDALQRIGEHARRPDAIIADYRLREGANGIEVIQALHAEFGSDIPALLITGDTGADRLREVRASGYPQLHKPVPPAKLRAVLTSMLAAH